MPRMMPAVAMPLAFFLFWRMPRIKPMMAGIAELVMRTIAAVGLSALVGYTGICFASPIAWIGSTVILISSYYVIMKKLIKKHETEVSSLEAC